MPIGCLRPYPKRVVSQETLVAAILAGHLDTLEPVMKPKLRF